ncbi:MAG: TrkA C-terminal domain-containing protein [Phycisphaerales bacterium]|nr:TrkA C-terminal domain-containing protein [Phycisphaerales bacterium]
MSPATIYSVVALLIIAAVSFLLVRIGAIALMMTGLPRETSNFQAISAFFGVGFTTREAELVVGHPVRRRIVQHLIVAGNLGLTSGLATFIIAVIGGGSGATPAGGRAVLSNVEPLLLSVGGVLLVVLLMNFGPVRAAMEWTIRLTLRRAGVIRPTDYDLLLRVVHGYVVSELTVGAGSPLAHRSLAQAGLGQRGVLVLGISRVDGSYVGAPAGRDIVEAGDMLIVYGREEDLAGLNAHMEPRPAD